jgi:hypothetical protein
MLGALSDQLFLFIESWCANRVAENGRLTQERKMGRRSRVSGAIQQDLGAALPASRPSQSERAKSKRA